MAILDNFEVFIERITETCYYCQKRAEYDDIVKIDDKKYDVAGVCKCHAFKGLSS